MGLLGAVEQREGRFNRGIAGKSLREIRTNEL